LRIGGEVHLILQTFAITDIALQAGHAIRQSGFNEPEEGASRDATHAPSARLVLLGMS
jgi:hypothetical protein